MYTIFIFTFYCALFHSSPLLIPLFSSPAASLSFLLFFLYPLLSLHSYLTPPPLDLLSISFFLSDCPSVSLYPLPYFCLWYVSFIGSLFSLFPFFLYLSLSYLFFLSLAMSYSLVFQSSPSASSLSISSFPSPLNTMTPLTHHNSFPNFNTPPPITPSILVTPHFSLSPSLPFRPSSPYHHHFISS